MPPDMRLERTFKLQGGLSFERYQQYHGNARVLGGQITLYRNPSTEVEPVIGAHYPKVLPVNRVGISRAQAMAAVDPDIGPDLDRRAELMIDPASGRYFYRIESRRPNSRWVHWIDAGSAAVLNRYDALMTECAGRLSAPCGQGAHFDFPGGITADIKDLAGLTTPSGSGYLLLNARVVTHDQGSTRRPFLGPVAADSNDEWITEGRESPGQGALVDAHYYVNLADDYFRDTHGFNLGVFHPMPLEVHAHYTKNYVNAFWNGSYLAFGDGDGVDYDELTSLDVAVHEFTHAVTEYTSGLIYQNESGALNESFSDIMATSVELLFIEPGEGDCSGVGDVLCPDWLIGEDFDRTGDAMPGFRNMADPEEDGLKIDHYSERYTGTSDNGGVHWNSAIPNHAYYLLAQPMGTLTLNASCASKADHASAHCDDLLDRQDNDRTVAGIGLADAEQVFFLAFIGLNADADMCEARAATEAIASARFGKDSPQRVSTADAWIAVGLTDIVCGGAGSGPADNPPSASIINPLDGATVTGLVRVQVSATDDLDPVNTLDVELVIDGIAHGATFNAQTGYFEYDWDTAPLAGGSLHSLVARVTDSGNNSSDSQEVQVSVQGSTPSGNGSHISDLDAYASSQGGTWTADVEAEVRDTGELVAGAVVEGTWSLAGAVSSACTTDTSGRCRVSHAGIRKREGQVTFTVTRIRATSSYNAELNFDPDADSDGTRITVLKP
ncbi:M4 family metallopeptidase [Marinobacterium sediminicola]|uniref:M4 family metallopeptidase n=1 Tax=Marinobacterium sediminicola TaxID=518898 RepID=UPI001EEFEEEC|nr:M4 family metallopeptidase [Marinobacterium sediminicola]ULG68013.1 M4 family metallopeptidase [Marinobacterium sediminicola]